jgi:predicted kinase
MSNLFRNPDGLVDVVRQILSGETIKEEVELDEAPLAKRSHRAFGYELYHKDFSSAMQHAYKMAKKNYGITVDPKEIDDKVATGPRKPSEGKTNKYRLKGDKGAIQVQVYNKGGSKPFELNMYKEEVELDEYLEEGVNDPAIFKAVFLAGGPGSGKSFIVGKTGLVNIGMKLVNSDDDFERRLKNAGLDAGNPDDIFSPQGQALRGKAKKTTANKQDMYIKGRLGLVLDGTGKDYDKIKKVRDQLVRIGYDTAMIFVNTNLETSLERNRMRARSLPDAEVEKMWKGVQDNLGKFQKLFGANFTIVDNSEGADTPGATNAAYKKMVKFAKQPPKSRAAKNWIANEKSRRGIKEAAELDEFHVKTPSEKETMGIVRNKMPQVAASDYPEFFEYLKENGAKLVKKKFQQKT